MYLWRHLTNLGKFVVSAIPIIILVMFFTIFGLSLSHLVLILIVILGTVFVWGITESVDQFVEDIRFERDMRHIRRNGPRVEKKVTKRVVSKEDPYGEEDWEH